MDFQPEVPILFTDHALLVVNKPANLPTIPDGYDRQAPCLKSVLEEKHGRLWVVHRLDKGTSGVIVFARTADAHRSLNLQFEQRQATKIYHALIAKNPDWTEKTIQIPLLPDGDRQHRTVADRRLGKTAVTELHVLERFKGYALVQAIPRTGRLHQIRAHFSLVGFPVVVDKLYGRGEPIRLSDLKPGYKGDPAAEKPLLERTGLHAWSLQLAHPVSGDTLTFQAVYPKDFAAVLTCLRKL